MIAAERTAVRLSVALVLVAALGAPAVARADDAKADALFKEGRALLDKKSYDEACPKLAEAQRLESGAGTLLALALCHEGQGKTATARRELEEAAELGRKNGRADLAKAADKRAAAMEASLSKIVVRMPEGESSYDVRLDGEPVPRERLGAPIAVDPGEHKADVSAKGKAPRSYVVRLSGAGTVEIVIERLDDAAKSAPAPAAPEKAAAKAPAPKATIESEPPPISPESGGGAQRAVGLTLGGLGVAGLAVAGYFGGKAISEHDRAGRACTPSPCADAQEANDSSKDAAKVAVISATAGFVSIGVGAIVYFTAPKGAASQSAQGTPRPTARLVPEAGPTQAGVRLVGTF